jgi:2-(1,2-epoxy-1,2-dihydrophenyl)acetyl-CoA isomerase
VVTPVESVTPVLLETRDRVARIRLNRPGRLNVIDLELARHLAEALTMVEQDHDLRVLLLTGEGRSFMADGDLTLFRDQPNRRVEFLQRLIADFHRCIRTIRRLPIPVVAGVQGSVAGAGIGRHGLGPLNAK